MVTPSQPPGPSPAPPSGRGSSLADPVAGGGGPAGLGARRAELLARLQGSTEPRTAAALAEETGVHLNTVRFHLDALVEQGWVERRREERATRGRPRVLYSARTDDSRVRSYHLLAGMLTSLVRTLGATSEAADAAGRDWGRHLVEAPSPLERLGADDSVDRLHVLMDRIGFAPRTRPAGEPEVHLHHCPFLELVDGNQDVICALHRGLMAGALEQLGAPVAVESLEPFARPGVCVARLSPSR